MHVYSLQAALTFWVWDSCSLRRRNDSLHSFLLLP
jgi:hypothetical protein